MANDFSGDSNCVALYRFESGALTTDSKGSNTLTDVNTVNENTTDESEGACCAEFIIANNEYFKRSDSDLSADFPLKSGTSNNLLSICFFVEMHASGASFIASKYETISGGRSWALAFTAANKVKFWIGYTDGNSEIGRASCRERV